MIDKSKIKENVKVMLSIDDNLQDPVLDVIIEHTMNHLEILLDKEVPKKLQFILVEVSIIRFNRRGAEGMASETIEGHRTDFNTQDFENFRTIIEREKKQEDSGGTVRFFP